jgi:predicted metalloprotease with PDZ domain
MLAPLLIARFTVNARDTIPALLLVTLLAVSAPRAATAASPATIRVDLRQAPQAIFHADLSFPAKPGPMRLAYPRWIPGDHAPAGPIENLTGLVFTANGTTLPWTRDPKVLDEFEVVIPKGATRLDVHLDFLAVPAVARAINPASTAATDTLAVLRWHTVLLYPVAQDIAHYTIEPSVLLPAGWQFACALPAQSSAPSLSFAPVTLEKLVDSPLLTGRYFATYQLTPTLPIRHTVNIVADDPADLVLSAAQQQALARLALEAHAMYGSWPFDHYDYLINISARLREHPSIGGQEHGDSSDDTGGPGVFSTPAGKESVGDTLSHEYSHSWNGKYRRPAGEKVHDYQQPYDDSLNWVYEGLTTYLGHVLAARAGFWSLEEFHDEWANDAAAMNYRPGRLWRSLQDSSTSLPTLMRAGGGWTSWRRSADYYPEGALFWLDVDVTIRKLTANQKSLDDFLHLFLAKQPGRDPTIKAYDFAELAADLEQVVPNHWTSFLRTRLDSHASEAPLGGLTQSGWHVTYSSAENQFEKAGEGANSVNADFSIGASIKADGVVEDVIWGGPSFKAGLGPGMKILTVDDRPFSVATFRAALDATTAGTPAAGAQRVRFLISNGGPTRLLEVTYQGGQRYPRLERSDTGPDYLAEIARPRSGG